MLEHPQLLLIKIFLNSMISMLGAQFATAVISNFYLMTPFIVTRFCQSQIEQHPRRNYK